MDKSMMKLGRCRKMRAKRCPRPVETGRQSAALCRRGLSGNQSTFQSPLTTFTTTPVSLV